VRSLSICLLITLFACTSLAHAQDATESNSSSNVLENNRKSAKPNILFIIMDDVGIDQLRIFGYGGIDAPSAPNIDTIARAGLRFRNVWSMPECSPSRAIFFEGRYPLRTNVYSALLPNDLANSQVSPHEVTTPIVLRQAGYQTAMFGKFHLGGPDNNPFERGSPHALGWDYFDGFLVAAPAPIDTTLADSFPRVPIAVDSFRPEH
jgi:arylsulfatase A-like enzyme